MRRESYMAASRYNKDIGGIIMQIQQPALFYEYERLLDGSIPYFSSWYFDAGAQQNDKNALLVCRYAFEIFLGWRPEEVGSAINLQILKKMKLIKVLKYMSVPWDILSDQNFAYLCFLLYPSLYPEKTITLRLYEEILSGQRTRFPKHYFDGADGIKRACVCLRYYVQNRLCGRFSSVNEIYRFFASPEGQKELVHAGLSFAARTTFRSPVLFYHMSLPASERDDLSFHYWEFWYQMRKQYGFRLNKLLGFSGT